MAAGGFLALLDDVTTLTKIATKKVSGVVGDDLALNAKAMAGINQDREIPLIKKVAIGSLKNKAILLPAALALSVVSPLLMKGFLFLGGAYLCYEGAEKIAHSFKHRKDTPEAQLDSALALNSADAEKQKISSAIRTDFILSAEITVLALNEMITKPFLTKALALTGVGFGMTLGVYSAVAGILRMDNAGMKLMETEGNDTLSKMKRGLGKLLVNSAPPLMKVLGFVGTAAMFSVGGGILLHAVPAAAHAVEAMGFLASTGISAAAGIALGFASIPVVKALEKPFEKCKEFLSNLKTRIFGKKKEAPAPTVKAPEPAAKEPALTTATRPAKDMNTAAQPQAPAAEKKPDPYAGLSQQEKMQAYIEQIKRGDPGSRF